jgi:uncharacterized OsmC-like protein
MGSNVVNGIDVDQLVTTIGTIKDKPDLANFNFRAKTTWVNGGHSQTAIQSFYGPGQEDTSRSAPLIVVGDEPPVLLGTNKGPNAVEMVLAGLSSCLAVGFAYNAAARGLTIEKLEFEIEGDIDLLGFLGISDTVRPGYQNIRVSCNLRSEASDSELSELFEHVKKTSPVLDIVRNPVDVDVELKRI